MAQRTHQHSTAQHSTAQRATRPYRRLGDQACPRTSSSRRRGRAKCTPAPGSKPPAAPGRRARAPPSHPAPAHLQARKLWQRIRRGHQHEEGAHGLQRGGQLQRGVGGQRARLTRTALRVVQPYSLRDLCQRAPGVRHRVRGGAEWLQGRCIGCRSKGPGSQRRQQQQERQRLSSKGQHSSCSCSWTGGRAAAARKESGAGGPPPLPPSPPGQQPPDLPAHKRRHVPLQHVVQVLDARRCEGACGQRSLQGGRRKALQSRPCCATTTAAPRQWLEVALGEGAVLSAMQLQAHAVSEAPASRLQPGSW
jgi:hypothetical protein